MASKFKIGDILILKNKAELHIKYGWNKNMTILINKVGSESYTFDHLVSPASNWFLLKDDSWNLNIIHENFKLAPVAMRVLYGK